MGLMDFLKSTSDYSKNQNDGDKLFSIVIGGITELERNYKNLPTKGKFEVLIFNSLLVLMAYRKNHPDKYSITEYGVLKSVINQAKAYQINQSQEELINFFNARIQFYAKEHNKIYKGNDYLPGKIYSAFYLTPLISEPEFCFDLDEVMPFFIAFTPINKWVSSNANNI